ncbi:hypothetical protein [Nocardioides sp.]|uniref:hypothetical protein n=1 Tax=Nocardioides sp. TaxID=35761 RepID=UPI001A1C4BBA|nr:hypothetical protein [Nocardioides sp.]MBJ7358699.1 hypothetical protein [Nocardioides sp.]
MSHDDLATLLRHDLARDEPHWLPDVAVPISTGRRVVRRRRAGGAAAAAALAVACVVSVPLLVDDDSAGRVLDPAEQALAAYDAQEMPSTLEDHARDVLGRSVADLGPATFTAGDGQGDPLRPELYDKASGMAVEFGDDEHSWSVDLSHARGEAEGDAERYCAEGLAEGFYFECTVDTTARGYVVISQVEALRPMGHDQHGRMWLLVPQSKLEQVEPSRLWFEQRVKVIKSETLVTYATERVRAPTLDAARSAFLTPEADLVEIGADPALVIPEPPTDDSGCGPWTQDDGVTYSC